MIRKKTLNSDGRGYASVKEEVYLPVKSNMDYQPFVHLHLHDDYSLLDGFSKVEDYAKATKERGWKYLCVTNHGLMGQIPRQYNICKELGITPIYGCEVYVNNYTKFKHYMTKEGEELFKGDKEDLPENLRDLSLEELRKLISTNYHLVLLAKNNIGFKNLIKITSQAWIEGFYRKPRVDLGFIAENSEGLICGSACLAGPISRNLMNGRIETAYHTAEWFKDVFGDDFYIELMLLEMDEQKKTNRQLMEIAKEYDIDLVLTNDCHYLLKEDSYYQDILLLLQNNKTIADLKESNNLFQFDSKELWYKTAEELDQSRLEHHNYIPLEVYEQAKRNTVKFAEKCNVEIDTSCKIPQYTKIPEEYDSALEYLKYKVRDGLEERGLLEKPEYIERIKKELGVIERKNYADYFLIVEDLVRYARENNILVGPGRGSAAGSLLTYSLGITDVDPLEHGLIFERFLNEGRADIPDVDIDFAPDGRNAIKEYIVETYGRDKTCAIGTYGSFGTKATVADVCRAFNVPLATSKFISKQLDGADDLDWEELLANEDYGKALKILDNEEYFSHVRGRLIKPLDVINKIRFKQKNISAHAAGFIISSENLRENLPVMTRDGTILSSWIEGLKGNELSTFGFVKWDILGLLNLVFIDETIKLLDERKGIKVDLHDDIDANLNNPDVYRDLSNGKGGLIFQFESNLMQKLLKDSTCDSFDCLAAITALGRPGPLQSKMTDEYIERKLGKKKYTIHPVLEKALGYTFGVVTYQEQVMAIAHELADFSLVETDNLRKILIKCGKRMKHDDTDPNWVKLQKYKKQFIEGGKKHMEEDELSELFDGFLKWAGYGFNKCLTGDTVVIRSSGNQHGKREISIKELYDLYRSKTSVGKKYRMFGYPQIMSMKNGTVKTDKIKDIVYNGKKKVFRITVDNGNSVKATSNHRFLSLNGWKELGDFCVGEEIAMMGDYLGYVKKGRHANWIKDNYVGRSGGLGFDCGENNPAYKDGRRSFFENNESELRQQYNYCQKCEKTHNRLEIHHKKLLKDFNYDYIKYHSKDNLIVLCPGCHKRTHYSEFGRTIRHGKGRPIIFGKIISIEFIGVEDTYDLEMFGDEHNFVANGFISHNSHAVSYTVISYRCAYLKTYYPTEYICAVLRNVKSETVANGKKKNKYEQYFYEAQRLKVKILPFDINESKVNFNIEADNLIRFGFFNLKGVGQAPAESIVRLQPFSSFDDFLQKSKKEKPITKSVIIPLILVGAFDSLCGRMEALIKYYIFKRIKCKDEHKRLAKAKLKVNDRICSVIEQVTGGFEKDFKELDVDTIDFSQYELSKEEKAYFFKNEVGFDMVHPFMEKVKKLNIDLERFERIVDIHAAQKGAGIGIIKSIITKKTRKGSDFYILQVEDGGGSDCSLRITLWEQDYKKYSDMIIEGRLIYFDVVRENPDYSNFTLNYMMDVNKLQENEEKMRIARDILFSRIRNKDKYTNDLSKISVEDGNETGIIGYVVAINNYAKKRNVKISDNLGMLDVFEWADSNKMEDLKEGDVVKVLVRRRDYQRGFESKKSYQVLNCKVFSDDEINKRKEQLKEQELLKPKKRKFIRRKKC